MAGKPPDGFSSALQRSGMSKCKVPSCRINLYDEEVEDMGGYCPVHFVRRLKWAGKKYGQDIVATGFYDKFFRVPEYQEEALMVDENGKTVTVNSYRAKLHAPPVDAIRRRDAWKSRPTATDNDRRLGGG
jgi:hypothetical protein